MDISVLGNPQLESARGGCIAPHTIAVRRDRMVGESAIHEIIAVTNFGGRPAHLSLELAFAADFIDIFVVRGIAAPPAPILSPAQIDEGHSLGLCSIARDGVRQATRLGFSPPASRCSRVRSSSSPSPVERLCRRISGKESLACAAHVP